MLCFLEIIDTNLSFSGAYMFKLLLSAIAYEYLGRTIRHQGLVISVVILEKICCLGFQVESCEIDFSYRLACCQTWKLSIWCSFSTKKGKHLWEKIGRSADCELILA